MHTLLHSIVHLWRGEDELYNDSYPSRSNAPCEQLCDEVVELLFPTHMLSEEQAMVQQEPLFNVYFLQMLYTGISEGSTSYIEAYRLTGTDRNTFPQLISQAEANS